MPDVGTASLGRPLLTIRHRLRPRASPCHAYSRLLNSVEGNTTFYATPTPSIVARWRDQALAGFRFVFKVPKHITHDRRLRGIATELAAFCQLVEPLGDLVGGFTLQLAASFGPDDLDALEWTLRQRSSAWRWSVEVRHAVFFSGAARSAIDSMLTSHGVDRVLLDTESLFSHPPITDDGRAGWEQKTRVPALHEALTDNPIVRFIGTDDPAVTAARYRRLTTHCRRLAARRPHTRCRPPYPGQRGHAGAGPRAP